MTSDWTTDLRSLSRGSTKSIRELLAETQKRGGWVGRKTGGNHVLLKHRNGGTVTVPGTPGNPQAPAYLRGHIRHAEEGREGR